MPELHLKEPGFTYSPCGPFTKHRERIQKLRETGNLKHLYRNELGKACFAHHAAYSDSKDLAKRTIWDKILKDRAYEIVRNCNYGGYQRAITSMVYKFFDEKLGSGISVNEELAAELHKPVINNFKRRKVYATFKDNISAADLAEMRSLSSMNKNVTGYPTKMSLFFFGNNFYKNKETFKIFSPQTMEVYGILLL